MCFNGHPMEPTLFQYGSHMGMWDPRVNLKTLITRAGYVSGSMLYVLRWLPFRLWIVGLFQISALNWMRLLALALSYNPDVYCPTLGTGRRRFSVPWNGGAPCPFRPYFFRAEQCLLVGWSLYSLWSGPSLAQRLLPRVHSDTFYAILKLFLLTMLGSGAPLGINLEEVLYNFL